MTTKPRPKRAPSGELVKSTSAGVGVGALIEFGAAAFGLPLPPGSGAALAGLITGAVHYFQGKGRKE